MNDTIYRRDVIQALVDTEEIKGFAYRILEDRLMEIPSVDRPQKWIPCGERLPANDDWVIISVLDEVGDTPYRYSDFGWYFERAKCWIVESEQRTDVVAWMPFPEPYGEREDE